jgi:hypothetical protein
VTSVNRQISIAVTVPSIGKAGKRVKEAFMDVSIGVYGLH